MLALRSRPAGVISNHPLLHWLKTVVVSDVGKGAHDASGRDRGRRSAAPEVVSGVAVDASLHIEVTSEPGTTFRPGRSLAGVRLLARRCPAWRRREPDLLLPCGTWEGTHDTGSDSSSDGPLARGSVPSGDPTRD
jgi:hypothetical protein